MSAGLRKSFALAELRGRLKLDPISYRGANMSRLIRIPTRFFDDHVERNLPAPRVVRVTGNHYFIEGAPSDELNELLDDAQHYAEPGLFPEPEMLGIVASARATARAIEKARG